MIILRAVIAVLAVALAASILWAMQADDRELTVVLRALVSDPWTVVTLIDLYLGFVISAVVIFLFERRMVIALLWAAPVFFLGNVWTAIWFIARLPALAARLHKAQS